MVKLQKCLHFSAEARKLIKLNILFAPNTRLYVLHVNRAVAIRRGDGGVIAPLKTSCHFIRPFVVKCNHLYQAATSIPISGPITGLFYFVLATQFLTYLGSIFHMPFFLSFINLWGQFS
jgi:hypothetical protein